jgi:hypothetical protein
MADVPDKSQAVATVGLPNALLQPTGAGPALIRVDDWMTSMWNAATHEPRPSIKPSCGGRPDRSS